jgi:hypothetical protein
MVLLAVLAAADVSPGDARFLFPDPKDLKQDEIMDIWCACRSGLSNSILSLNALLLQEHLRPQPRRDYRESWILPAAARLLAKYAIGCAGARALFLQRERCARARLVCCLFLLSLLHIQLLSCSSGRPVWLSFCRRVSGRCTGLKWEDCGSLVEVLQKRFDDADVARMAAECLQQLDVNKDGQVSVSDE